MKKELSEMTLEELWNLFPIYLTSYQPEWAVWYQDENRRLSGILPAASIVRISHIGSTAVPAIQAKPIIDILVEAKAGCNLAAVQQLLEKNGYLSMAISAERISLNRGYTPEGFAERVFHLHLRFEGDHDELYFRDYLNGHPEKAKEYEALKLSLWKKYEHDRDAYTEGKTELVRLYTAEAKRLFAGRYEQG